MWILLDSPSGHRSCRSSRDLTVSPHSPLPDAQHARTRSAYTRPMPSGHAVPRPPHSTPSTHAHSPVRPMPSAHALPHPHAQHASARPPTMPSAHALLHPTPAQLLFPGHQVLTCFPGRLGPTSGGCSPAASHRQTWHPGRHSAESPESSSVKPKQKVIGLPWE